MKKFPTNPIFLPNYDESILSISTSLLKYYGVETPYTSLPELDKALAKNYKNVVLMIFDGMGFDLLKRTLNPFSFLRRKTVRPVSSVFPPTTTAATSTFYSGLPPVSHGWLAWACYFKECNHVVELFRNKDFYTQQKIEGFDAYSKLAYEHILEKISNATNGTVRVSESFPSFCPNGVDTLPEMFDRVIENANQDGKQFILAYWTEPDHTSHEDSPYAKSVKNVVRDINNRVRKMCAELKDTLVIISADHGHIPVESSIYVNDCENMQDCFAVPLSMDDRVNTVFLKPEKQSEFLRLFDKYLKDDFILMTREEALATNLFGQGKPHPQTLNFLGDYLIISTSYKSLRQRVEGSRECDMKGTHSGLTKIEMQVPLIMVAC